MDSESVILCKVCLEKPHNYTCPRCNIQYCSVACYKHVKHADCSELFYRDLFIKELSHQKVSLAEKQAILESIKRIEEDNPIVDFLDEEEEVSSLNERLHDIDIHNLDDDVIDEIWDRLTLQEREDFQKRVQNGHIFADEIGEAWKPWWLEHSSGLVSELDNEDDASSSDVKLPKILKLSSLKSDKVLSPLLGFNLLNIIYSHVFHQRLFNGCGPTDFNQEFCESCILSSDVLRLNQTYQNAEDSLCSCMTNCLSNARKHDFELTRQFPVECIRDVSHVLIGPDPKDPAKYTICLLSELHSALKRFRKLLKSRDADTYSSDFGSDKPLSKLLFEIMKKIEFLISWCLSYPHQLSLLSMETSELYRNRIEQLKEDSEIEKLVSKKIPNITSSKQTDKPLIVELQ